MVTPTHIQVAILRTKGLIVKGKHGSNDAFVIIAVGKQKFQTSIKEKVAAAAVEWKEGCDIAIPSTESNKGELVLKVLHKASMGENFLGRAAIPLSDLPTKPTWYPLKPKPGNEKDTKSRGEIEIKVTFLIKSNLTESTSDLKSKRKDSFRSSLGSILSLGKKKNKKDKGDSGSSKESMNGSTDSLRHTNSSRLNLHNKLPIINDDPGVISDEEEEINNSFNNNQDKSKQSNSSVASRSFSERLNSASASLPSTPSTPRNQKAGFRGLFRGSNTSVDNDELDDTVLAVPKPRAVRLPSIIPEEPWTIPPNVTTAPPTPQASPKALTVSASMSNLSDGGKGSMKKSFRNMFTSSKNLSMDNMDHTSPDGSRSSTMKRNNSVRDLKIPKETYRQYERKPKEELVATILALQSTVTTQRRRINDLEDYIDKLLLRVLDNMPVLLSKGGVNTDPSSGVKK